MRCATKGASPRRMLGLAVLFFVLILAAIAVIVVLL
jgi:hypothetical protein